MVSSRGVGDSICVGQDGPGDAQEIGLEGSSAEEGWAVRGCVVIQVRVREACSEAGEATGYRWIQAASWRICSNLKHQERCPRSHASQAMAAPNTAEEAPQALPTACGHCPQAPACRLPLG